MAIDWRNGICGMVPQADWLDVGFQVTRQNDPIDGLFGDVKTDNILAYWQTVAAEYQIPMMAQFHGFDTEAQTTFRIPVDTHNIEKGLVKVKINQSERLREQMKTGASGDQAIYEFVIRDGVRLADQVVTRSKVAKNELMATGVVTVKENELDLSVDYGVPAAQKALTLDLSADADIASQIQDIIDAATAKGVTLTGIETSKKNLTKMRNNSTLQKAINGNIGAGTLLRRGALDAFLEDEFGISRIIVNDLTYGASAKIGANGRPSITQKRYFPDNKISFFASNPAGKLGDCLWGDPPEATVGALNTATASSVSPYVYIDQWVEDDPKVLWTKASALFMPILFNPSSLWIATVQN